MNVGQWLISNLIGQVLIRFYIRNEIFARDISIFFFFLLLLYDLAT